MYLVCRLTPNFIFFPYTTLFRSQINIKLHVGDVMDVLKDISDDRETELKTMTSYTQIRAIFIHTKDQLQILFLLLDWFISLETNDPQDRKSTRLNSSHRCISYAVLHRTLYSFPTRRSSDLKLI